MLGQGSVALFFMITGFLFWSRLLAQGRNHDWLAFGVSRVFRLYPLYLPLMLLVFVSVFHLQNWQLKEPGLELFKQILAWLTFDRPDINQYRHSGMLISNVTWTLAYEVFSTWPCHWPGWCSSTAAVGCKWCCACSASTRCTSSSAGSIR